MKRLDLTGKILDSGVVVTSPAGTSIHGKSQWNCACFCGMPFVALGSELRSGHTKSCGCYSRSGTFTTVHGQRSMTKGSKQPSEIYTLWINIKARCLNENHPAYPDYGGRGITMHQCWENSFTTFFADISATIGPRPPLVEGYERYWSIDRINNDGNYEIGNVRWANPTQQKLNQRHRRWWKKPEGAVI